MVSKNTVLRDQNSKKLYQKVKKQWTVNILEWYQDPMRELQEYTLRKVAISGWEAKVQPWIMTSDARIGWSVSLDCSCCFALMKQMLKKIQNCAYRNLTGIKIPFTTPVREESPMGLIRPTGTSTSGCSESVKLDVINLCLCMIARYIPGHQLEKFWTQMKQPQFWQEILPNWNKSSRSFNRWQRSENHSLWGLQGAVRMTVT